MIIAKSMFSKCWLSADMNATLVRLSQIAVPQSCSSLRLAGALFRLSKTKEMIMVSDRETNIVEMLSFAAKKAVDEQMAANKKRYFNTPIGSFMRKVSYVFQSINVDLKVEKPEQNPEYVWSLVAEVKAEIERAAEGRFEDEQEVLYLLEGVSTVYREYVAMRDDIDLENGSDRLLRR
jgi:hypothetical protein